MTFALAMNTNVKPDPTPLITSIPAPTPNQKPIHKPHSNSLVLEILLEGYIIDESKYWNAHYMPYSQMHILN